MDKTIPIDQRNFLALCRQKKLKITPQRTAIYHCLMEAKHHPTAEDIFEVVVRDFPSISFDTVYRTLNTFAEIGVSTIVEGFGKSRRFDSNMEQHHHFHCEKCGRILDFKFTDYDRLSVPEGLSRKNEIRSMRVVLVGLCEKCSKQSRQ